MTISDYYNTYGKITTLRKLGYNQLAEKLEVFNYWKTQKIEIYGEQTPFEELPEILQKQLNAGSEVEIKVHELLGKLQRENYQI